MCKVCLNFPNNPIAIHLAGFSKETEADEQPLQGYQYPLEMKASYSGWKHSTR